MVCRTNHPPVSEPPSIASLPAEDMLHLPPQTPAERIELMQRRTEIVRGSFVRRPPRNPESFPYPTTQDGGPLFFPIGPAQYPYYQIPALNATARMGTPHPSPRPDDFLHYIQIVTRPRIQLFPQAQQYRLHTALEDLYHDVPADRQPERDAAAFEFTSSDSDSSDYDSDF